MLSQLSRSSSYKTVALYIVEHDDRIIRAFAKVLPNKKPSAFLTILLSKVTPNSTIYIDEYRFIKNHQV